MVCRVSVDGILVVAIPVGGRRCTMHSKATYDVMGCAMKAKRRCRTRSGRRRSFGLHKFFALLKNGLQAANLSFVLEPHL